MATMLKRVLVGLQEQVDESIARAVAARAEAATATAERKSAVGLSVPEALEAGALVPFRLEDRRRDAAGDLAHFKTLGVRPVKLTLPEVALGMTAAVAELVERIGAEAVAIPLMGALEGACCRRGYVEDVRSVVARSPQILFCVFEDHDRHVGEHRLVAQPALDGLVIYLDGEAPPVATLGRAEVAS